MAPTRQNDGMAKDFLAEIVDERTRKNPAFPDLVREAEARRKLARRLAALREKRSLSQTVVAARMGTSASVVSKLEAGGGGEARPPTLLRSHRREVRRCGVEFERADVGA